MGGTNFDPNWLAFYALAYSAQAAYNWMTAPSPQSTRLHTRVVQMQPDVQVQEKIDRATSGALVKGSEAAPTKPIPQPVVYVPVQENPQQQVQVVPSPGQVVLSPHVLAAAMQYYRQHQAELNPTHQPVALYPSLPAGEDIDENGFCPAPMPLAPLTGRELTVRSPMSATDLTTVPTAGSLVPTSPSGAVVNPVTATDLITAQGEDSLVTVPPSGGLVPVEDTAQQTGGLVERRGFFRRHPTATATGAVGGIPLLGSPFVTGTGSESAGAGASSTGGASGYFWTAYENASSAAGKAYSAASSAASFAWNNTGWTTKLGLGIAAVGLTYYLARRYLKSQATVHVENNNYPTFNNNPTFKQDVHLHFPAGAKVLQEQGEDGVHYTIKAEDKRAREQFQKAVRQVIAQNKRAEAAAAA